MKILRIEVKIEMKILTWVSCLLIVRFKSLLELIKSRDKILVIVVGYQCSRRTRTVSFESVRTELSGIVK